ncbi:MAG TPA: DUF1800 family protein [Chloroflexi bacterium]|nr:DUF1800 family protein [Chloroflexota bacterium]
MGFSRRDFLKLGGLATAALSATSCSAVGRELAQRDLPESLGVPLQSGEAAADPVRRLLNRGGYGPRPGDLARAVEMGLEAYLEEQLNPEQIEDTAADLLVRNLTLYHMDPGQLTEQDRRDATAELFVATLSRALYSKRQLYEVMVEFWSDHFNIYLFKMRKVMPFLKILDDRDAIRPHALGRFRDLVTASVHSPAMLVYLDNVRNHKEAPNENYARELMELHTLGVHGGYTQQDVQEVARVLTGWTVRRRGPRRGETFLDEGQHDFGEKTILGRVFPAGRGVEEIEDLINLLVEHPSTATFIATKLVRRFVADEPPDALVERVAETYRSTDGDIKAMLRTIFLSEEFATAPPKLKRPYSFMISAIRALHGDVRGRGYRRLANWLRTLGQPLFQWGTPDGYPDEAAAWATNLLPRWNFCLALIGGGVNGVTLPLEELAQAGDATDTDSALDVFAQLILGEPLEAATKQLFSAYVGGSDISDAETRERIGEALAIMLASPAFQWA